MSLLQSEATWQGDRPALRPPARVVNRCRALRVSGGSWLPRVPKLRAFQPTPVESAAAILPACLHARLLLVQKRSGAWRDRSPSWKPGCHPPVTLGDPGESPPAHALRFERREYERDF